MAEETHANTSILLGTLSPSVYITHTCMHLLLFCIQIYVCVCVCIYVCVYIYNVYVYINIDILKKQIGRHTDNDIDRIFNRKRK